MKFIHLTDLHIVPKKKKPQSRSDLYHEHTDLEFENLKYFIVENDIEFGLISGDLFHHKTPEVYTPEDINKWIDVFDSFPIKFYVIPGNHDLPKSSVDSLRKSPYYTLVRGCENLIDVAFEGLRLDDYSVPLYIRGLPYTPLKEMLIPENPFSLASLNSDLSLNSDCFKIALVHGDFMLDDTIPLFWETASFKNLSETVNAANLLCLGHIHHQFPIFKTENASTFISKPWSFARVIKDYFVNTEILEKLHKPSVTLCEFSDDGTFNLEYKVIPHVEYEKAFTEGSLAKQILKNQKTTDFFQKLAEVSESSDGDTESLFKIISGEEFLGGIEIASEVRELIDHYLNLKG